MTMLRLVVESRRATVCAALLLTLVACSEAERPAFKDADIGTLTGADARPGQVVNFGFILEPVDQPIRLLAVSLLDAPKEVQVLRVWGDRLNSGETPIGAAREDLIALYPSLYMAKSIEEVLLVPGSVDWQIIVSARSNRPGRHEFGGLRVVYKIGKRKSTQEFPYRMAITVLDCTSRSDSVCSTQSEPPPYQGH